jgi:hypothetical protein
LLLCGRRRSLGEVLDTASPFPLWRLASGPVRAHDPRAIRRRYEASPGARRHRREARTMKPWRRGCAGAPCGLGPLCTRINPETAIHSNTGNSPCSLSVVNLLLRRKPARAAVAPAQRPRGSAFEPDTETRLPPRFRPGIAPPVGARIADGASVAQGILEFPFGPFRERSSRMD